MKALYKNRNNKLPGGDVLVDVIKLEEDYAHIKIAEKFFKWVGISRLKPYLDPDADGDQWIFLDYIIMKQEHPRLLKYAIFDEQENTIGSTNSFLEAKKIILEDALSKLMQ